MVCFRKKEGNVIKWLKLFSSLFVRQKTSHPFRAVSYPLLRCVEKDYERFNPCDGRSKFERTAPPSHRRV